jgi:hypothetical protein
MNTCIRYRKTAELRGLGVKLSVTVDEFYFEFVPPSEFGDVCAGLCLSQPISGWLAYPRSTRIIDLSESTELLFKSCSKNNRYEVERARQSDNVETSFSSLPAPTESQSSVSITTPSPRARASHRFGAANSMRWQAPARSDLRRVGGEEMCLRPTLISLSNIGLA